MPTPIEQLLSRTVYATDGTTVNWDFSFASGYLDAAHVKAQTKDAAGAVTQVTVTPDMLIGEFQLQITPALASGLTLTIYRDTPKNAPLVDFNDESGFSEIALDTNAKQAVMVAAEAIDTINSSDLTAAIEAAESAGAAAAAASASAALAAASVASIGTAVTDAEAAASAAIAAAASINPASFATAAQGALADSALQPGEAATPAQGALADSALQPGEAATPAQGALAGSAVQPGDVSTRGITQSSSRLLGRVSAGVGSVEQLTVGPGLALSAGALYVADGGVVGSKLSGGQSGGAPVYGVRAWCVFNGTLTGTNAPTAGGNIASITRTAVGTYDVVFVTAMPDVNYSINLTGTSNIASGTAVQGPNYARSSKTVNGFTFVTGSDTTTQTDWVEVSVSVVR